MDRKPKTVYIELFLMFFVFGIDQVSKWWAQMHDLAIYNTGGVFGILPSTAWVIILPVVMSFLVYEWWHTKHSPERWGMALLIVGGAGNIVDRLIFGAVRDFIYYSFLGIYGNIADIVLAAGVGLVMLARFKMVE